MSLGALSPEAHETLAVAMNRLGGEVEHRRGRRGPAATLRRERRPRRSRDQAGRLGPLRRHAALPRQRRPAPDQDRAGREARRGRPAARPQGRRLHRPAALLDAGRRPDLAAAAPRHLLDRGPQAADLRPALREPARATVSVKLVAEVGVGTVAAGVAKANADHVVIAGHDGGTGASPQSSIQAAGRPVGDRPRRDAADAAAQRPALADHRSRSTARCRPAATSSIAALLGADEFGFSTAPLIAMGCIMMRVCHLNTCPVGIATQDPELRERFAGTPEHVVNYLFFVAEEARELMAALGVRTLDELIGRADLLRDGRGDRALEGARRRPHERARDARASPTARRATARARPTPVLDDALDWELIRDGASRRSSAASRCADRATRAQRQPHRRRPALERDRPPLRPRAACPRARSRSRSTGSAGQSFGAWLTPGVTFTLAGEANDYAGKGLVRRRARRCARPRTPASPPRRT